MKVVIKQDEEEYNPIFIRELKRIEKLPPEKTFSNGDKMLKYLNLEDKSDGTPASKRSF